MFIPSSIYFETFYQIIYNCFFFINQSSNSINEILCINIKCRYNFRTSTKCCLVCFY